MKIIITNSVEETEAVGAELSKELSEKSKSAVVAFSGDLGVGKTAFVRGMCKGVGFSGDVSSPTFAIVHEYDGGKISIYHFDMYRISGTDDLYDCGFYDYLGNGILAIEWSEKISTILPEDTITVTISYGENDNQRIIKIEGQE